jgi:hypothetical protein
VGATESSPPLQVKGTTALKLSRSTTIRTAAATVVAGLAATAVFATPALAAGTAPSAVHVAAVAKAAPAPVRSGSPASTEDRVADFYGAYIDAHWGAGNGNLVTALRSAYLTKGFQKQLTAWENKNHADGVLRAQSDPSSWAVTASNAGMGHLWTTVVLTWAHGKPTTVTVQSDLATGLISGIE